MMTPEQQAKLRRSLVMHENYEKFPYIDPMGKVTIGIGYNLSDRGMPDEWIIKQYNEDVNYHYTNLYESYPWFRDLNNDRQVALVDMCFNLGYRNFQSFKKMIRALENHRYDEASFEMLSSKWAHQVNSRATRLAHVMLTGVYNI